MFHFGITINFNKFSTDPLIKEKQKKNDNKSNQFLMPNGSKFIKKNFKSISADEQNDFYYFEVKDSSDNFIGYIVSSIGNGYAGKLKIMAAFDTNLKILNAMLLDNNETTGLGKKALKQEYMSKFIGTNANSNPLPINKNKLSQEDKDSISGATVTFNGIVNALSRAIDLLKRDVRR